MLEMGDGAGNTHLQISFLSHVTGDEDSAHEFLLQSPAPGLCKRKTLGLREVSQGLDALLRVEVWGGAWTPESGAGDLGLGMWV